MKKTVDWLEEINEGGAILIGDKETGERRNYYSAIIGIAYDNSHIAYSRERLIRCFVKANNWSWSEAEEWVEYNVERSLPYYGSRAPVILNNNFVSSRNKKYIPLKIILDI